jgi:hypothetical protein
MKPVHFVCWFAILVSMLVVAQSSRAPLVNPPNGMRILQEPQRGMSPNLSQIPQGLSFAQGGARAFKATAHRRGALSMQQQGLNFAPSVVYLSGGGFASSVAVADVSGDGKPDIVVANSDTVGVLLGNGDGTFQTAVTYSSGGYEANSVAIADVNGDGKPDLLVANLCANSNCTTGSVGVLLGNGNGTFQTAVPYGSGGYEASSVAVADVNGDGKPDLAVANNGSTTVGILLGNGDGTFQTAVPYGSGGYEASSVAVADVNRDGKPDLLVTNTCADSNCNTPGSVGVLLGNGDGTFQTVVTYGSGGYEASSVAIADVNGDGKPDLLVTDRCASGSECNNGLVGVLLGNGDGTFQSAVTYNSGGAGPGTVAVGDVNGDGKLDLAVANCDPTNCGGGGAAPIGVLLGNGDGTFQAAVTYASGGNEAFSVAVADVNGDGKPDLLVATNECGLTCRGLLGEAGVLINTSLTASATALASSLNPSNLGQAVTFTATVTAQPGFYHGTPAGTVSFFDGTTNIGNSNLNGVGVGTLTTSTLAVGTRSITATYSGDSNFSPSTSPVLYQVVRGAIVSLSPASLNFGNQTVDVGSTPQIVTLENPGNVNLTIASIQINGTNRGDFSQTNNCPSSLPPNGSCNISVSFTPTTTGTRNAAVTITDNAPGSPQIAPLTGFGVQTASTTTLSSISPGTVAFGTRVTLKASVTSAAGPPHDGEIVTFKDSTTNATLGTGPLSKGTAIFTSTNIPGGSYSVVASYPGDAGFLASTSAPPQPLNVQDFKLSASPATVTVSAPGQSGSTTITITTYGNFSALSLTNWSCSGLPAESTCAFGTIGANSQISLSITTTAASDLRRPRLRHSQRLFYAFLLPGFMGVVSMAGRRRRLRGLRRLALIVVLGLLFLWLACGGGGSKTPSNSGTPTGNSSVTVSANGATLERSTTIALTLQ